MSTGGLGEVSPALPKWWGLSLLGSFHSRTRGGLLWGRFWTWSIGEGPRGLHAPPSSARTNLSLSFSTCLLVSSHPITFFIHSHSPLLLFDIFKSFTFFCQGLPLWGEQEWGQGMVSWGGVPPSSQVSTVLFSRKECLKEGVKVVPHYPLWFHSGTNPWIIKISG